MSAVITVSAVSTVSAVLAVPAVSIDLAVKNCKNFATGKVLSVYFV